MKGKLFLIPSVISDHNINDVLTGGIRTNINKCDYFIVENERTARRFLLKAGLSKPVDDIAFFILNKHTPETDLEAFLAPIDQNKNIGLISEAGVPCIADPGATIVEIAHRKNARVIPLVGPSSILLALMASGLNGQNFSFVGYLPIKNPERKNRIKNLELRSKKERQAQLFIETPYRNQQLFNDLVKTCQTGTRLCIASNITAEDEFIKTATIGHWKNNIPDIHKKPAIFILQS